MASHAEAKASSPELIARKMISRDSLLFNDGIIYLYLRKMWKDDRGLTEFDKSRVVCIYRWGRPVRRSAMLFVTTCAVAWTVKWTVESMAWDSISLYGRCRKFPERIH